MSPARSEETDFRTNCPVRLAHVLLKLNNRPETGLELPNAAGSVFMTKQA